MVITDLGMTGTSKKDLTVVQKDLSLEFILRVNPLRVHHGICIKADEQFHHLIERNFPHIHIIGHPPINKFKMARGLVFHSICKSKEYLARNRDIVDSSQMLLAFPENEYESIRSGTWYTVRYARKKNIPIRIIAP
jgi:hypothetical protein